MTVSQTFPESAFEHLILRLLSAYGKMTPSVLSRKISSLTAERVSVDASALKPTLKRMCEKGSIKRLRMSNSETFYEATEGAKRASGEAVRELLDFVKTLQTYIRPVPNPKHS